MFDYGHLYATVTGLRRTTLTMTDAVPDLKGEMWDTRTPEPSPRG